MTYATGAAWCLKRGHHRARLDNATCIDCGRRAPLFTDDDIDAYDARDAARDYVRSEAEAHDGRTESETDAHRGRPE